jgi:2-(1,2-epoxy-1,2-dihydrophenyl)acetyl-CoA isomerase
MAATEHVRLERHGAVTVITLDRPDVLTAFDSAMRCGVRDALQASASDAAVRAVVLTGAGRLFSAGADLKTGAPTAEEARAQLLQEYGPGIVAITQMPKPVIAALNGPAVGIGLAYALACDLRVIAEGAYLQAPFNTIGLLPDGGLSWLLPRLLGYGRAFELVVESRKVDAAQAFALGLVDRVVPDGAAVREALTWAQSMAQGPALAIAATKRAFREALAGGDLAAALEREAELQAGLVESADCAEGIAAFREKRDPRFSGR